MITKKLTGFACVSEGRIHHGTFNRCRHVAQAKMVTMSNMTWPELENGGYSVQECEASFECQEPEILGNGGEPIKECNEDEVRDDK